MEELQKKALGVGSEPNPLKLVSYLLNNEQENKPSQSDIRDWMETVHQHKDDNIMLTRIVSISQAMAATANSYIRNNRKPYHK
jgi:hypothetical protein